MKRRLLLIIIAIISTLILAGSVSLGLTTKGLDGYNYVHDSRFNGYVLVNGIDISAWQPKYTVAQFKMMKSSGVDFVILKCGGRWGRIGGTIYADSNFESNYKNAKAAGLSVGVYFFSVATNTAKATEEANYVLKVLKGKQIDFPVAIDVENVDTLNSKGTVYLSHYSKATLANVCNTFCKKIKGAGYNATVYASLNWLNNKIGDVSKYNIWVAQYYDLCQYKLPYSMWQYSSNGKISGINNRLDSNFAYLTDDINTGANSLSNATISLNYTRYPFKYGVQRKPIPTVTLNGKTLKKDVDYTISYFRNVKAGTAYVSVTGAGAYRDCKMRGFTITPLGLDDCSVDKIANVTYSGKALLPSVKITNTALNRVLVKNIDYKTTYLNSTNVGTATVVIKGINNYSGKLSRTFQVKKLTPSITTAATTYNKNVGTSFNINATAKGDGKLSYKSNNNSVATVTNTGNVTIMGFGKASITITSSETLNCNVSSKTVTITSRDKVSGVKASYLRPTSLKITWDKVIGASLYRIYKYDNQLKKYKFCGKSDTTSCDITGLTPNSLNKFYIVAYDNSGNAGTKSDIITRSTYPRKMSGIVETDRMANSVTISWNRQTGVTGYRIYRFNHKTNNYTLMSTIEGDKNTSYKVRNLKSSTSYRFKIRAYYNEYRGELLPFTLVSNPIKASITAVRSYSGKVNISWQKLRCTGYQIRYSNYQDFRRYSEFNVEAFDVTSKALKLTNGKKYYIKLRAYKEVNEVKYYGLWSTVKSITCK